MDDGASLPSARHSEQEPRTATYIKLLGIHVHTGRTVHDPVDLIMSFLLTQIKQLKACCWFVCLLSSSAFKEICCLSAGIHFDLIPHYCVWTDSQSFPFFSNTLIAGTLWVSGRQTTLLLGLPSREDSVRPHCCPVSAHRLKGLTVVYPSPAIKRSFGRRWCAFL